MLPFKHFKLAFSLFPKLNHYSLTIQIGAQEKKTLKFDEKKI